MAHQTQNNAWISVPQFGGWDEKGLGAANYSMVFSQARDNRKQQKTDVRRSLGNEQEFIAVSLPLPHPQDEEDSVTALIPTYLPACMQSPDFLSFSL
ncbi:hypothetical protein REPUB_Repub11eG0105800 [Reevesia pubescens]